MLALVIRIIVMTVLILPDLLIRMFPEMTPWNSRSVVISRPGCMGGQLLIGCPLILPPAYTTILLLTMW